MRNLVGARSVVAKASSVRSATRGKRKALIIAGALVASLASGSSAWAQCAGAGGANPFLPFAAGGTASVNSLVSVLNTVNTAFLTQSTAFVGAPGGAPADTNGGGVWSRGIGGRIDNNSTGTLTFPAVPFFGLAAGTITCETQTRQTFGGYQVGADISRINLGNSGGNIHFGVTAGYTETNATDVSPGGSFTGNFQVPFAGLYAAFTQGGLFIDGQLRFDFYQNRVSDATNGVFAQEFDGRGVSVTGNIGYNWGLGNGWFIEPSIGVIHSRVNLDPLNISGTLILAASPGIAPPGSLQVAEVESTLGRASLRVGTNFTSGGLALQPFATASVFHEFADNVQTSLTSCFGALTGFPFLGTGVCGTSIVPEVNAQLSTSRVGTYGQFALGVAGQIINTGWLGYVRADYRTGENIDGWTVNGGIRYQFTPDPVLAKAGGIYKSPVKAVVAGPAPVNWTGFYVGAYTGANWGFTDWNFAGGGGTTDPRFAGFIAGGQAGVNYQVGSWVFGVEGDIGGTNAQGARPCPNLFFFTCESHMDWLSTVTGRVGFAWNRTLFYVKGGGAFAEVTNQTVFNPDGQPVILIGAPPTPFIQSSSATMAGWTVGAGFEYALSQNWSARAEYMHYDLGTENFRFVANTFDVNANIRETGNLVRIGVNYRFGWTPASVVASY